MRFLNNQYLLTKLVLVFALGTLQFSIVEGLDFESVVLEALKSNPELQGYYKRFAASQKNMIQVRALPEPKVTYTDFLSEVQTRTGPQERILQFNQPFPWPGKLALLGGIANREAEVAFFQYESLQREIVKRITDSYYEYAFLGQSIRITQENVSYINQLLPTVEEKVRGGGKLADVLVVEIEKEKIIDRLRGLRERRPIVSSRLETDMGRKPDLRNPLPFPGLSKAAIRLPDIAILEKRLEKHPQIAAASSKVLSYELKQELAAKSALPDLSLGASVIDIGNRGDTGFGIMLGFNLPIRKHKYRAQKEQASLETESSILLKTSIENDLRSQLHREYQLAKDAQRTASLFGNKLVPKAKQSLAQLEDSYRGDKSGIDEIIDGEGTLLQLQLECLKTAAEARRRAIYVRVLTEPVGGAAIQAVPVK